jgi:hypothetical protein
VGVQLNIHEVVYSSIQMLDSPSTVDKEDKEEGCAKLELE